MPDLEQKYLALREQVQTLGLYERRYEYYALYSLMVMAGTALSLYLITASSHPLFQALNGIFLSFVLVQAGMLGHDGSHGQIFATRRLNRGFSTIALGLFGGLSENYWHAKHSAHHTHVNHIENDPDLNFPFSFSEQQLRTVSPFVQKYILPYQHILFFLALPLIYTEMLVMYNIRSILHPSLKGVIELWLVTVHFTVLFYMLFAFLPVESIVAFLVMHVMTSGVYLSLVFAPNHKGMDVLNGDNEATWRHQIELTRNLRPSVAIFHLCGGLNFQIEHHLFPNLPRPNYWHVQPLVKKFCNDNGIDYYETTWWQSVKEIYAALKTQAVMSASVKPPAEMR